MSDPIDDKDYKVGYGHPPKHSRFKPGHSGNPSGRKRGSKNLDTLFKEEMELKISGSNGDGTMIAMTKKEAFVKRITNAALKGEPRATSLLLQQLRKQEELDSKRAEEDDLSPVDFSDPQAAYDAWQREIKR